MSDQSSFTPTQAQEFETIVRRIKRREIGVGDARDALVAAGYFSDEFNERAIAEQQHAHIRAMFRKIKDKEGMPCFYNVQRTTDEGVERHYYKQLNFLTQEEGEYVARDYHQRGLQQFKIRDHVIADFARRGIHISIEDAPIED